LFQVRLGIILKRVRVSHHRIRKSSATFTTRQTIYKVIRAWLATGKASSVWNSLNDKTNKN